MEGNEAVDKYFLAPREPDARKRESRTFEVNEMWELHHEIVRRLMLGQKNVDIARALNVSEQMVSYTRNSKVVQKKLDLMRAARDADTVDVAKYIRDKVPKALALLEDIIDDHGENYSIALAAKTAENWVDRGGFQAPRNVNLLGAVAHFTSEEIEKIKEESRNKAVESGTIVEGEVEEVTN